MHKCFWSLASSLQWLFYILNIVISSIRSRIRHKVPVPPSAIVGTRAGTQAYLKYCDANSRHEEVTGSKSGEVRLLQLDPKIIWWMNGRRFLDVSCFFCFEKPAEKEGSSRGDLHDGRFSSFSDLGWLYLHRVDSFRKGTPCSEANRLPHEAAPLRHRRHPTVVSPGP